MNYQNLCKLVFFLSKNARIKTKELGRLLNMSQQNISYNIKKLQADGIIKSYNAVIDPSKFGYVNIILFLNYKNFNAKTTNSIKKYLIENPNVVRIEETVEGSDLLIEYCVPNLSYFNKQHKEFMYAFNESVQLVESYVVIVKHNYTKNYLHKRFAERTQLIISGDRDPISLDEKQIFILREIVSNPIIPIVKIAEKYNLDPKTIRNNIKFLERKNIIRKYSIVFNHEALDITREFIFLSLAPEKLEDEKKFMEFCNLQKNIVTVTKVLGKYDILITSERLDKEPSIIKELRKQFKVINYRILTSDNIVKHNFLPENID